LIFALNISLGVTSVEGPVDNNPKTSLILLCTFLEELEPQKDSRTREGIFQLMVGLLELNISSPDLSQQEHSINNKTNSVKLSIWKVLCLLSKFVDTSIVQKVSTLAWEILQHRYSNSFFCLIAISNFGNIRYLIQLFLTNVILRCPSITVDHLVAQLQDPNHHPQVCKLESVTDH
jgi:hypothetical protein